MTDYDIGAPTQQVNAYEPGRLIAQIMCETSEEARTSWPSGRRERATRVRATIYP